jgi:hypothetical protein
MIDFRPSRVYRSAWAYAMRLARVRFTIRLRTCLLVILILGLWVGWNESRARGQKRAVAEVKKYNRFVQYDYEFANGKTATKATRAPEWIRRLFGDDYIQEVTGVTYIDQPICDTTLAPLDNLGEIEELCFVSRMHHGLQEVKPPPEMDVVTEAGLARLEKLTRLRRLVISEHHWSKNEERYLRACTITGRGLGALRSLTSLKELRLGRTLVDDAGLAALEGMTSLEVLELYRTPVSDFGLVHLRGLKRLKKLDLSYTKVTHAGVERLKKDLPALTE